MTDQPRWSTIAAVAAPASALAWGAAYRRMTPAQRWRWAGLPVLLCHQVEEWVWPGGFPQWLNREVMHSGRPDAPLSARIAFAVNVPVGWGLTLATSALGDQVPFMAIAVCVSDLGNAALHLGWAARNRRWNPGAATAGLLIVPWATAGLRTHLAADTTPRSQKVVGLAVGTVASVALLARLRRAVLPVGGRMSG